MIAPLRKSFALESSSSANWKCLPQPLCTAVAYLAREQTYTFSLNAWENHPETWGGGQLVDAGDKRLSATHP